MQKEKMTNEKTTETAYKNALIEVLQSTTGAEIPPELMEQPELIAQLLADRFKHLSGAEESVSGLMELSVELANRGDRWKKLSGRAYDTLSAKRVERWKAAAELAEKIIAQMDYIPPMAHEFEEVSGDHPEFQDLEYLLLEAREDKTHEEAKSTYRERYVKAASFVSSEQMAERVQASFKEAQKQERADSPIAVASNSDIIMGLR